MPINTEIYKQLSSKLSKQNVTLVAVSKAKSADEIRELYNLGQRDFGENYVQELVDKHEDLPEDIRWHFIGHLQTNKVKYIAPFVSLIQSVDSEKLLREIDKQAQKNNRVIDCLLQVYIAKEETKFGLDESELALLVNEFSSAVQPRYHHVRITGLMGMASFTSDHQIIQNEFAHLHSIFEKYRERRTTNFALETLSMGMSADYQIAVENGSNLVRIGSLLFGAREKAKK